MTKYAERFIEFEGVKENYLERVVDGTTLSLDMCLHVFGEITSYGYTPMLDKVYYDERKLSGWLDALEDTWLYKAQKAYFRHQLHNGERIPKKGGALIVSNHSSIPWDVITTYFDIHDATGRGMYSMAHHIFERSDFAKCVGGIVGQKKYGLELLKQDKLVYVCPGGAPDALKPFSRRYKVEPIHGFSPKGMGYLQIAIEAGVPIVPVGIYGAEEIYIKLWDAKPHIGKYLDTLLESKLVQKTNFIKKTLATASRSEVIPIVLNVLPLPCKVDSSAAKPLRFKIPGFTCAKYKHLRDTKKGEIWKSQLREYNEIVMDSIRQQISSAKQKQCKWSFLGLLNRNLYK